MPPSQPSDRKAAMGAIRSRFPAFGEAVWADARANAYYRGERHEFRSRGDAFVQILRLCWQTDAFLGQVLYRAKASMQRRGIPLLPRLAHKLAMATSQISIGDPVVVGAGLYVLHGQIVIDGLVEIGPGARIAPWVTIGLRAGNVKGATIGSSVEIGTGAKVIGPVTIGDGVRVAANAVVVSDAAPGVTMVGVPARPQMPGTRT